MRYHPVARVEICPFWHQESGTEPGPWAALRAEGRQIDSA
jgi:hypothetical protein